MQRFKHQKETVAKQKNLPAAFNTSDPGTGKTCCMIDDYIESNIDEGRALVFAPLSILRSSWGDDINKFAPGLKWAIAHGKNKKEAFKSNADMVICNHDGVKWIAQEPSLLKDFNVLYVDESTAFKHRTSQRSKALAKLARKHFDIKRLMTGTPNPRSVLDLWHQAYILDGGQRLGSQFFRFRDQVCVSKQTGPSVNHVRWEDRPGAQEIVADALSDIVIRYKLEDCIDMPEHSTHFVHVDLSSQVRQAYERFSQDAYLDTENGPLTAINAAVKAQKLLQLLAGVVYNENGDIRKIHSERAELAIQLIAEREHTLCAFNWRHERDQLTALADKMGITYGIIDGSVPAKKRSEVVERYQNGELQTLFCHPASTAHGLTLTRGTATIWPSPTHNAEHFIQFNKRIYRAGQTKRTETICICARNTREEHVYQEQGKKIKRVEDILSIFGLLNAAA